MSLRVHVPGTNELARLPSLLGLDGSAEELRLYLANANSTWLTAARPGLDACQTMRVRVGLDLLPQGQALLRLRDIASSNPARRDVALVEHTDGSIFHPKVYAVRHGRTWRALVGSSNGSSGGFGLNLEANLLIEGPETDPEVSEVLRLTDLIEHEIEVRARQKRLNILRLPHDPLPIIKPAPGRRAASTEADEAVVSDGWEQDPSFLRATHLVSFDAPLSGMVEYVTANGHQGGFDIDKDKRSVVEALIPRGAGADLRLRWRFVTNDGATIFAVDEDPRRVVLSGYGGHNRVITASKPTVARPAYEQLKAVGVTSGLADIEYRLDRESSPPALWMIHRVPDRAGAFSRTKEIT